MNNRPVFLIVGAGFSGAVLARELAENLNCQVLVLDERDHIGGNCHTERDSTTGVMVHRYGPHIFNTNNGDVWTYVNRFGEFRSYINRVKAITPKGLFSLPINLLTINQLFGRSFRPAEARKFVNSLGDKTITNPANFEEQALSMFGRDIYETFFKGYTIKQWGCDPRELPAAILKRLPIRFTYDDSYYDKRFQGIPAEGYTEVIRRILDHPNIEVHLGEKFEASQLPAPNSQLPSPICHTFYTGPIDAFFQYSNGRLGYRTVTFERIETEEEDYQGNAVINYTSQDVPFTRIHEHKHFTPWETHRKTVAFREFSKETTTKDTPYYPKRLADDLTILESYRCLAGQFATSDSGFAVSFLGRLATYRYMDMEQVIAEALEFSRAFIQAHREGNPPPVFPAQF